MFISLTKWAPTGGTPTETKELETHSLPLWQRWPEAPFWARVLAGGGAGAAGGPVEAGALAGSSESAATLWPGATGVTSGTTGGTGAAGGFDWSRFGQQAMKNMSQNQSNSAQNYQAEAQRRFEAAQEAEKQRRLIAAMMDQAPVRTEGGF